MKLTKHNKPASKLHILINIIQYFTFFNQRRVFKFINWNISVSLTIFIVSSMQIFIDNVSPIITQYII